VVRERYQRPKVQDLGSKWKLAYWDYSSGKARKRSKVWAKSRVPLHREAQRLADQFMEMVNELNNNVRHRAPTEPAVNNYSGLVKMCRQKTWPLLKKPTRLQYDYFNDSYLLPRWGEVGLGKLRRIELQDFFNSFWMGSLEKPPKTVRLMHACMRAALNEAKRWGLLRENPAVGVKLPRKKARKQAVILEPKDIRRTLKELPEPSRSICTLIVIGSMRPGEVLALRRKRVLSNRMQIVERLYDDDFDEVKTEAGEREIPFDRQGLMKAVLQKAMKKSPFKDPDDLVFSNRKGGPLNRRNLLKRQSKSTARKLGLPEGIDFYSFRKMHSTLMRKSGARAEVVRDNMGHSESDVTLDIYSKSYWSERREAVSKTAGLIWPAKSARKSRRRTARPVTGAPPKGKQAAKGSELEPQQLEPQPRLPVPKLVTLGKEWSGREDLKFPIADALFSRILPKLLKLISSFRPHSECRWRLGRRWLAPTQILTCSRSASVASFRRLS
jgi:integrase